MSAASIVLLIVFVMLYLAFLFWYGGRSKPLSQAEVESLLAEIKRRGGNLSQEGEPPLFQQFRDLAKSDDGREFYMVNLLKFRKKAIYPEGSSFGDDPMIANNRYSWAIIPLLIKHGSHPVFLGQVQGRFLHPGSADDWDQVGMVRYRSCRDMLQMAVEIASLGIDIHKWAALEKNAGFPGKALVAPGFYPGDRCGSFVCTCHDRPDLNGGYTMQIFQHLTAKRKLTR